MVLKVKCYLLLMDKNKEEGALTKSFDKITLSAEK